MCAFSLQVYEQLARESGLRFAQIGKLLLGFTSEDLDAFERSVSFQQSIGLDGAVVLGHQGPQTDLHSDQPRPGDARARDVRSEVG
jgi:hypothetical protein